MQHISYLTKNRRILKDPIGGDPLSWIFHVHKKTLMTFIEPLVYIYISIIAGVLIRDWRQIWINKRNPIGLFFLLFDIEILLLDIEILLHITRIWMAVLRSIDNGWLGVANCSNSGSIAPPFATKDASSRVSRALITFIHVNDSCVIDSAFILLRCIIWYQCHATLHHWHIFYVITYQRQGK